MTLAPDVGLRDGDRRDALFPPDPRLTAQEEFTYLLVRRPRRLSCRRVLDASA
jgi:hypothetical protein